MSYHDDYELEQQAWDDLDESSDSTGWVAMFIANLITGVPQFMPFKSRIARMFSASGLMIGIGLFMKVLCDHVLPKFSFFRLMAIMLWCITWFAGFILLWITVGYTLFKLVKKVLLKLKKQNRE